MPDTSLRGGDMGERSPRAGCRKPPLLRAGLWLESETHHGAFCPSPKGTSHTQPTCQAGPR